MTPPDIHSSTTDVDKDGGKADDRAETVPLDAGLRGRNALTVTVRSICNEHHHESASSLTPNLDFSSYRAHKTLTSD